MFLSPLGHNTDEEDTNVVDEQRKKRSPEESISDNTEKNPSHKEAQKPKDRSIVSSFVRVVKGCREELT